MRRTLPVAPLLLLLGIYSLHILLTARDQAAVTMVDYWYHLQWARQLALSRPETWIHPFYPAGYFALLRLGLDAGVDVARYGQFLSWAGSVACLAAVYAILYAATRRISLALAGAALLALHPFFRFQALQEGTDMLAAGLQLAALAVVFMDGSGRRRALLTAGAAGALLGGAYLIRYTTLTLLPVVALYLWLRDRGHPRDWLLSLAFFAGLFGLVALPQLAASTAVTGRPLYNEQARNVWFGLHGDFNWTENWGDIPPDVTLMQIARDDPAAFAGHWAREFGRFLAYDGNAYAGDPLALERKVTLWEPLPLHVIWLASAVLLLFDRRLTRQQKFLLLAALFVPVLVTSMAWLFTRYLLVPLAVQVVLVVLAAGQLGERLARTERMSAGISLAVLFALAVLFWSGTTWAVKQQRTREIVRRVEAAQPLFEAIGVEQPAELMTNNRLYQRLDQPDHPQYLLFQSPGDVPTTIPLFLDQIKGPNQPGFLLFDWTSHAIRTIDVEPYRSALTEAKDQLAPLRLTDDYSLYCVLPCGVEKMTPIHEALGSEMALAGYRAFAGQGDQRGLYLYWKLNAPVATARPITLTLRNAAGDVLFQSAGDPQLGTYPADRWSLDEVVADYHLISSAEIIPGQPYYLTVALGDLPGDGPPDGSVNMTIPIYFVAPA